MISLFGLNNAIDTSPSILDKERARNKEKGKTRKKKEEIEKRGEQLESGVILIKPGDNEGLAILTHPHFLCNCC